MPRPLTRTHRLELRLTEGEHAALVAIANGRPLGPLLIATAVAYARPGDTPRAPPAAAPPTAPRDLVALLVSWAEGLTRYSTSKTPLLRLLPQLAALVRDA